MKRSVVGDRPAPERGAGTALMSGLALSIGILIAAVVLFAHAGTAAARSATAADLAALAGADASRGIIAGDPCTVAAETAAAHGATLLSCGREGPGGTIVEVRTALQPDLRVAGFGLLPEATGRARAGPPP